MNNPLSSSPMPDASPEQQALQQALAGMMSSVARLSVARGLPYAAVEEMLRIAFVQAAARAHPGLPEHRKVSRISTTTGINRREVTRLVGLQEARTAPRARSLVSEVFAHWRTHIPYRDAEGQPRELPRQGPAPSFETLAHEVTRDVHPRSLLDELCRLGLAAWDEAADTVALARDAFVPHGDRVRLLGLLGDNVGDHLRAAVDNVLADDRTHFEQALFADGLSLESVESIRPLVREQWQTVLAALVPTLEARIAADVEIPPAQQRRLRVGLYTYQEEAAPAASPSPSPTALEPRKA
ncbi:conserved hypothetical protein [Rubrivivax sp. A210]|uniref:DUF6502 family protein n=1 Tax=Rubrivivax sp. A210 TaxID=2772301 RepID=UPI001919FF07|nr:DUF6502 family protein [Rubrivivax sp. A210]CAD5372365.1 conserved hypothetical protein [Rubrivivax sp. A210]